MKLERVKNTKRNILWGLFNQFIVLIFPFIVRTIIIKKLGVEYLGLNGLFGSMLQILNLAELGFGNALVYQMYKPIVEDDKETINALMRLYREIYRIIGLFIGGIGMVILPFLPKFIKGGAPVGINIYILYLIYLVNTVLSYWMFAYKTSLLNAFQRTDVISNISTVTKVLLYLLQIIVLLIWENYYVFLLLMPVCTIINNVLSALIVKRLFPEYKCEGNINKERIRQIFENVKGLALYKICQATRNTFDSIFISAYLGLAMTAIYTNYYYVTSSITTVISVISSSILAGVGNSIAAETKNKNYKDFKRFNFLYMWIGGWSTICLLCLIQPFMKMWVGQEMMFDYKIVILLCAYFYILKMGDIKAVYSDAAGLWWENRFRTLLESASNFLLNYLLVRNWGIYGIIIATIITLLVFGFGFGSNVVFKYYFKNNELKSFFVQHFKYALVTGIVAVVTLTVCRSVKVDGVLEIIIRGLICCIIPNVLYGVFFCATEEFKDVHIWVIKHICKKSDGENDNDKDVAI